MMVKVGKMPCYRLLFLLVIITIKRVVGIFGLVILYVFIARLWSIENCRKCFHLTNECHPVIRLNAKIGVVYWPMWKSISITLCIYCSFHFVSKQRYNGTIAGRNSRSPVKIIGSTVYPSDFVPIRITKKRRTVSVF